MISQAMQNVIGSFLERRRTSLGEPRPSLEQLRGDFSPAGTVYPIPDDVEVKPIDAGGVPAHWLLAPGADSSRVLLYFHGGAWMFGSIRSHGELAARIGRSSGMPVLAVDYRLAPEYPFPAAIDDALAAWNWLRNDQGIDAASIALSGDSAGGGLALALLVALRDSGATLPAAAALMSPAIDLTGSGASMTERVDQDPILTPDLVHFLGSSYLAGANPQDLRASPLFASLVGLPPLLVQVGTAELLFSDSERLAKSAADAGVDVTLRVGEGLPHVYQSVLDAPEALEATEEIGAFLRVQTRPGRAT